MIEIFSLQMSEEKKPISLETLKLEGRDKHPIVKMKRERKEALMRIVIGIVSGIVLAVWKVFTQVLAIVNFFYTLAKAKRSKELAEMCELWNTQLYIYIRYMIF